MSAFRTLTAWQKGMDLVDAVYDAVETFPKTELYALGAQLRKAVVSIPSLIAEGRGRYTTKDRRHFYVEARGSSHEIETELEIAMRRKFIAADRAMALIEQTAEVGRLISGLIRDAEEHDRSEPSNLAEPSDPQAS
jgi:four helix bundle protein